MSNKFSSSASAFNNHKQDEWIRQVVQNEDIKSEIQTKIKSIDKAILGLRTQLKKVIEERREGDLGEVIERLQRIEADMQVLKYHQQCSIKNSRAKSLDKERKPIFKKSHQNLDFSSIMVVENDQKIGLRKNLEGKEERRPPFPREPVKRFNFEVSNQDIPISPAQFFKQERQIVRRNPILQNKDEESIRRWLNDNRDQKGSCFKGVIREEDIEQSVFY